MKCPIDGTELVITHREGIEIDYCPQCRGVWLDRGELDKIIERSEAYLQPNANTAPPPSSGSNAKRKNDARYFDDHDTDYPPRRHNERKQYYYKKRKSFLKEVFDIFD